MQPHLRQDAVVLTRVAAPLEDMYARDLQAQSGNEEKMLLWSVHRAQARGWWNTAQQILATAFSSDLHDELGLTGPCRPPLEMDLSIPWIAESQRVPVLCLFILCVLPVICC